jgi:hypothetical protein
MKSDELTDGRSRLWYEWIVGQSVTPIDIRSKLYFQFIHYMFYTYWLVYV